MIFSSSDVSGASEQRASVQRVLSRDALNKFPSVPCSLSSVQICSLTLTEPKRSLVIVGSQQEAMVKQFIPTAPLQKKRQSTTQGCQGSQAP